MLFWIAFSWLIGCSTPSDEQASKEDRPRTVELTKNAVSQFHGGVAGIVRGALVGISLLVYSFPDVSGTPAGYALDRTEDVVHEVAPMTEHVYDDASAVFLTIVPARPLSGLILVMPGEHPVSKLSADGKDLPEESLADQGLEFPDSG